MSTSRVTQTLGPMNRGPLTAVRDVLLGAPGSDIGRLFGGKLCPTRMTNDSMGFCMDNVATWLKVLMKMTVGSVVLKGRKFTDITRVDIVLTYRRQSSFQDRLVYMQKKKTWKFTRDNPEWDGDDGDDDSDGDGDGGDDDDEAGNGMYWRRYPIVLNKLMYKISNNNHNNPVIGMDYTVTFGAWKYTSMAVVDGVDNTDGGDEHYLSCDASETTTTTTTVAPIQQRGVNLIDGTPLFPNAKWVYEMKRGFKNPTCMITARFERIGPGARGDKASDYDEAGNFIHDASSTDTDDGDGDADGDGDVGTIGPMGGWVDANKQEYS